MRSTLAETIGLIGQVLSALVSISVLVTFLSNLRFLRRKLKDIKDSSDRNNQNIITGNDEVYRLKNYIDRIQLHHAKNFKELNQKIHDMKRLLIKDENTETETKQD
jgi:hypothetical protein